MKKRLFSLCVSVCLAVVAGTSMSSTAYYYENDVDEVGDMISIYHDMLNGVVVQTDGTVPDAADFEKYEIFRISPLGLNTTIVLNGKEPLLTNCPLKTLIWSGVRILTRMKSANLVAS